VQTAGGADAIVGAMQHREFTTTDETWADAPGVALLGDPIANRGTAFSAGERRELGLDGLLLSPSILRLPSMWRGLAMLLPFSLGLAVPAVGHRRGHPLHQRNRGGDRVQRAAAGPARHRWRAHRPFGRSPKPTPRS
jgi:hypothetical protein